MGGGGGKFIIVDKGGGGGADVIGFVLIEGGGGMAVVGGRFVSGFSRSGTFGPIRSLSSDGLESNSEQSFKRVPLGQTKEKMGTEPFT